VKTKLTHFQYVYAVRDWLAKFQHDFKFLSNCKVVFYKCMYKSNDVLVRHLSVRGLVL